MGTHTGMEEFKFRAGGTWRFVQILCSVTFRGEQLTPGDPRMFQDLVAAANNFDAAVARIRESGATAKPAPAPAPPPAPEVVVLEPGAGAEVAGDKITVRGVAVDARGIALVRVANRIATMQPRSERAMEFWLEDVALEPGDNEIEIVVRNAGGAEGQARVKVRRVEAAAKPAMATGLSLGDVRKLLEAGVTPARLETIVRERGVNFALTEESEAELRKAGATDALLLVIAKAKR